MTIEAPIQVNIQTNNTPEDNPENNPVEVPNEYNAGKNNVLKSYHQVVIQKSNGIDDYTDLINNELEYYSVTRDIEIGTVRCNTLQACVDKMISGDNNLEGKVRIAIMNRGTELDAFVLPDGTICISQVLINFTKNFDELAGVIAHEIVHIKNKTFEERVRSNLVSELGISWVHELASDSEALHYLEKVGLNSLAVSDLFERISRVIGNDRGTSHQSGLTRSVTSLGIHSKKDTETSHQRYLPHPDKLITEKVNKTNLEIFKEAIKSGNYKLVNEIIPKLHKNDFTKVYNEFFIKNFIVKEKISEVFLNTLYSRLKADGVGSTFAKIFLIGINDGASREFDVIRVQNFDELTELAIVASSMDSKGIYSVLCKKYLNYNYSYTALSRIIRINRIYEIVGVYNGDDKVATLNSFAKYFVSAFYLLNKDSSQENKKNMLNNLTYMLRSYMRDYHFEGQFKKKWDITEVESIFRKIKAGGIESISKSNYDIIKDVLEEKFDIYKNNDFNQNIETVVKTFELVFGDKLYIKELVIPEVFGQQIGGKDISEICLILEKISRENKLNGEQLIPYIQEVLSLIDTQLFTDKNLVLVLENVCGKSELETWINSNYLYSKDLDEQSVAQIIKEFGLPESVDEIYKIVHEKNKISRIKLKFNFLSRISIQGAHPYGNYPEVIPEELFSMLVENTLSKENPDLSVINYDDLFNTLLPILRLANGDSLRLKSSSSLITNFERFSNLSIVKELISRKETLSFNSIEELTIHLEKIDQTYYDKFSFGSFKVFGEGISAILFLQREREELFRLMKSENITTHSKDFPNYLKRLIEVSFPDSGNKTRISKYFLRESLLGDLSIEDKIQMLRTSGVGPEEVQLVAEQINDLNSYRQFQEVLVEISKRYLKGNKESIGIAALDFATSEANDRPEDILATVTIDPEKSKLATNDFAGKWLDLYIAPNAGYADAARDKGLTIYDQKTKKILIPGSIRDAFSSYKDLIFSLKNLSSDRKFAIALKCLTDKNGLLSSGDKKKLLTNLVLEGLELNNDFFNSITRFAIKNVPSQIIGLPVSQILSKFLFRGLDLNKIDSQLIGNQHPYDSNIPTRSQAYYSSDIEYILKSSSEDLAFFGIAYSRSPDSNVAKLAQRSNSQYKELVKGLISQIEEKNEDSNSEQVLKLPASTEALIKAGEFSPLFIRAMQIATQMIDFSPEIQERLSETQDSVKANGKGEFWMNLVDKSVLDPKLGEIVNSEGFTINKYLGGGSLFTTYTALIPDGNGTFRKVVIKTLNPNAEAFINKSYDSAISVLHDVALNTNNQTTKLNSNVATSLVELANLWCKMDINDGEYNERDDQFRVSIEEFNKSNNQGIIIEAPQRIYTSKKVKIEEQYEGITLNKLLNSKDVSIDRKKQIIGSLVKFFEHQFSYSAWKDSSGENIYVFHSDPHAGNYMINQNNGNSTLGVIDRSMYLPLKESEVRIFRNLLNGKGATFVGQFVAKCLELNEVKGKEAIGIKVRIAGKMVKEFAKQSKSGQTNPLSFLQIISQEFLDFGEKYSLVGSIDSLEGEALLVCNTIKSNPDKNPSQIYELIKDKIDFPTLKLTLEELESRKVLKNRSIKIPVRYNLMIRNIVAMNKLKQRYG